MTPKRRMSGSRSNFPECVSIALRLADELEQATLAPFPDLDDVPQTAATASERVEEAVAWGRRIHELCAHPEGPKSEPGLRDLFATPFDARTEMPTAEQILKRQQPRRTLRHGGLSWARDVLGDPPSFIDYGCNSGSLAELSAALQHGFPRAIPSPAHHRINVAAKKLDLLSDWHLICAELSIAYRIVRMQSLFVVTWIRERTNELEAAVLPQIYVPPDEHGSRSFDLIVLLAGRVRERQITNYHRAFLATLKREGCATAYRSKVRGNEDGSLEKRVPELRGLIEAVPGTTKGNDGTYRIGRALRDRIRLLGRPKATRK